MKTIVELAMCAVVLSFVSCEGGRRKPSDGATIVYPTPSRTWEKVNGKWRCTDVIIPAGSRVFLPKE